MGHYYNRNSNPEYTVKGKNGKDRDTIITDARKLKLVPSVTEVLKIPSKPGLEIWKLNQVLEAVLNNGTSLAEKSPDRWKAMIMSAADESRKASAETGNKIHDAAENYFLEGILDEETKDYIVPCINEISKWAKDFTPEVAFAHRKGFGGKIDLISRKEKIIIDFKTKQDKAFSQKSLKTDDYCVQLSAYALGLDMDARCYNVFINVGSPGKYKIESYTKEEVTRGKRMFECLLKYWQFLNNYDSSWED